MADISEPDEAITQWCAGLPLKVSRPFTDEERILLQQEARYVARKRLLLLLGIPITVCIAIALFLGLLANTENIALSLTFVTGVVVLAIAVIPLEIVYVIRYVSRDRALNADLNSGHFMRFEGVLAQPTAWNESQKTLLGSKLLQIDPALTQWIEVLPASGRVWRANGQVPHYWTKVSWVEVADSPAFARIAAEWLTPVKRTPQKIISANSRALSSTEQVELNTRIRRLRKPAIQRVCFAAVLLLIHLLTYVGRRSAQDMIPVYLLGCVSVYFVLACILSLMNFRTIRLLRRDLKAGRVNIVQVKYLVSKPQPTRPNEREAVKEILPVSRLLWTEEGKPAAWRKS